MADPTSPERSALDRVTGAFRRMQDKRAPAPAPEASSETPTPPTPPTPPTTPPPAAR